MSISDEQKKSQPGLIQNVREDITAYFNETTVHGFQYVVGGRDIIERLFWISLIISGFTLSSIFIRNALKSWSDIPLQTTIDKVSFPVEKLDFPAITVCDTETLQMPRRNRWMYLEKLLNWVKLSPRNEKQGK